MVSPVASGVTYRIESGWTIIKANTSHEPSQHRIAHLSQYAHRVLTFYFLRRMHQPIGKFTVSGEQQ
jgi:hypothetical protein